MSVSSLGLDQLSNLSELLDSPASNRPLEINLADIIEDPQQPRTEFDPETLAELAETIRLRGVKTPISIRQAGDKYIINHGARRYRASILAGRMSIPAWIDSDYTEEDQVIENIHRDALTAREIAEFIGRKMSGGQRQVDIAKALGKSKAYVSQYVTLLDLPEPIAAAFNAGRTSDVTLINELVTVHKKDPELTVQWLQAPTQEISRGAVKVLKDYIAFKKEVKPEKNSDPSSIDAADSTQKQLSPLLRKPIIGVQVDRRDGKLLFTRRPTKEGFVWVSFDGEEQEVKIDKVKLLSLTGN